MLRRLTGDAIINSTDIVFLCTLSSLSFNFSQWTIILTFEIPSTNQHIEYLFFSQSPFKSSECERGRRHTRAQNQSTARELTKNASITPFTTSTAAASMITLRSVLRVWFEHPLRAKWQLLPTTPQADRTTSSLNMLLPPYLKLPRLKRPAIPSCPRTKKGNTYFTSAHSRDSSIVMRGSEPCASLPRCVIRKEDLRTAVSVRPPLPTLTHPWPPPSPKARKPVVQFRCTKDEH